MNTSTTRSLEEITAELRYIDAKLRKFELDQVTKPFADTRKEQGLGRAVTGAIQRTALSLVGKYDTYVATTAQSIEDMRKDVAAFESDQQQEIRMRDLYHQIRDRQETRTYKDTRHAFREAKLELATQEAGFKGKVAQATGVVNAWAHYNAKLLLAAGIGIGAALAVTLPTHNHFEHKDRNRPIYFKANAVDQHPLIRTAIATHNMQMYLDDTWNHGARDDTVSPFVAYNWESSVKDDKFTGKDSAVRPWALEFERAKAAFKEDLVKFNAPINSLANGNNAVQKSWKMTRDETGHWYTTTDCSTDSKGNTTCTTTMHYQCDYVDFNWYLDHAALLSGAAATQQGLESFPKVAMPHADKLLDTKQTLQQFLHGKTKSEVEEYMAAANKWRNSSLLTRYGSMLRNAQELAGSGVTEFILKNGNAFPQHHHQRTNCSAASDYPFGWSEHERLVDKTFGAWENNSKLHETLGNLDGVVPKVDAQMRIIGTRDAPDAKKQAALRDLADLSRKVYNMNYEGSDWKATRGQRILFEWLLFTGLAAGAGFGAYKALDKFTDVGYRRRMGHAGIRRMDYY